MPLPAAASARERKMPRMANVPTTRSLTRTEREHAAADAQASVRAEGLDPSGAESIVSAWTRGEIDAGEMVAQTLELIAHRHGEPDRSPAGA